MTKTVPTRPPDVTIPESGNKAQVNVWIEERFFEITEEGIAYNCYLIDTIQLDDTRYGPLEYLEYVARHQADKHPKRAAVAGLYLIERALLGDSAV